MRLLLFAFAMLCIAVPASAQEQGIFIFDFSQPEEAANRALAERAVADAEDIADAAAIYCSTNPWADGARHRAELRQLLLEAGSASARLFDAGFCTPDITGFLNEDIGENSVWLALTNVNFLERFLEERSQR